MPLDIDRQVDARPCFAVPRQAVEPRLGGDG